MLLADLANNDEAKVSVYIQLGRYYSFYKREEKALNYLHQAKGLAKGLVEKGKLNKANLGVCYYSLCSTYRELNDMQKAKVYLDSCYMYHDTSGYLTTKYYLAVELGHLQFSEGKLDKSLGTFSRLQPWFEKNSPGFQVLLFTYIGDVFNKKEDLKQAENYYQKAVAISSQYKSHLDFIPTIYERLAKLYAKEGNYKNAFANLRQVQALDQQFFDSRSKNNASLLEIKDEFRIEKENQKQVQQEQRLAQLEQEERVAFLQRTLLLVTIFFLIFAGLLYFNYVRNKHKAEKTLIKTKRELEIKQAGELLELKNRELAASSIKLIEKDEILSTLKERLSQGKGGIEGHELKKIVRSISHSNAQNWEEFETRFTSVNKDFYKKLNTEYPKLSRGDLKLCSLIKLNLTSKEMAKLLGISLESVHTNRYRLRKKLALTKDVSLTEFVGKF